MITLAQRFRRRPAQAVKPEAVQQQGADPYAWPLSVTDALRELDAREAAEDAALGGVPTFTPHPRPAAMTAPQPVMPQHVQQPHDVLTRVLSGLYRKLGTTPIGDATAREHVPPQGRKPEISRRWAVVTAKRVRRVPLPAVGGDYHAYLAEIDRITGTTGPHPVLAAVASDGGDHGDR